MWVAGQRHATAALPPQGRTGTHCTGSWVFPRAGLDRCGKTSPQPGFDPRAVPRVPSRYTDWAIAARDSHNNQHRTGYWGVGTGWVLSRQSELQSDHSPPLYLPSSHAYRHAHCLTRNIDYFPKQYYSEITDLLPITNMQFVLCEVRKEYPPCFHAPGVSYWVTLTNDVLNGIVNLEIPCTKAYMIVILLPTWCTNSVF